MAAIKLDKFCCHNSMCKMHGKFSGGNITNHYSSLIPISCSILNESINYPPLRYFLDYAGETPTPLQTLKSNDQLFA